ncbi:MAG: sigma-54-dependent Fis family transcriptional regulator [Acidobacteria bacterium]|nr:MAG: sigma-54-dependent Fis family transcriptional regulator [Acidobacteriota bacterium]
MKSTESRSARILIADDQSDIREALRLLLKGEGYQTDSANSPAAVLQSLEKADYDVVLMDLNYTRDTTSGKEGLDLLSRIQSIDSALPVIVMTAWGSVDLAVETMRRGARDFLQKPWDNARVLAIIQTQVELRRALRKEKRLEAENRVLREDSQSELIAKSPAMKEILQIIHRIAPSDANVLITGENGTGKTLIARVIHASSSRAAMPIVMVNTGGLSESIFESELFGHVKGAFTDAKSDRVGRFELADGGTLCLDEIANISLNQQSKLLRVVETGEFEPVGSSRTRHANVRILSATNANLQQEVSAARFRQDLLFRLNTIEIHLPALRDRREDIPVLAEAFLRLHASKYRKNIAGLDPAALNALLTHSWPGNIRELDHVLERAVLLCAADVIRSHDLSLQSHQEGARRLEDMSLEEVEAFLIKKALERHGGNVSHAAHALGLSRSALYRRLQRYGL